MAFKAVSRIVYPILLPICNGDMWAMCDEASLGDSNSYGDEVGTFTKN